MSVRPNLTVTVDTAALKALGTTPSGSVYRYFQSIGAKIDAIAKRKLSNDYLHVRTGNLRSSQSFRVETDGDLLRVINENVASYAAALHDGSRPHDIAGRRSPHKLLTGWTYGGAPVFTPLVHHPGTKAKPWLRDAQREVLATLR